MITQSTEFNSEAEWRSEALRRGLKIGTSQKTGQTVAYLIVDGKTFVRGRILKTGQNGYGQHTAIQGYLTDYIPQ